jgi:hypothetical protein
VTVLVPYSFRISAFGTFEKSFQKRSRRLDEAIPQRKIPRYDMARTIEFPWKKAAFMGADISAFEPTGTYPLNRKRVLEYFFSISDTSETVTFMETAPLDMVPICAPSTSGINSQNVLHISAGPSVSNLNTTLPSDTSPEEVTPCRHFKISPVPKIPRKYSISEKQLFCSH